MKVRKNESITNMLPTENNIQGVVNPVMAKAMQDSAKYAEMTADFYDVKKLLANKRMDGAPATKEKPADPVWPDTARAAEEINEGVLSGPYKQKLDGIIEDLIQDASRLVYVLEGLGVSKNTAQHVIADIQASMKNKQNKSVREDYNLVGQDGNAFALMGYTASAMRDCGLKDEIGEMRERATSGDYYNLIIVCDEYIQRCNKIAAEVDDEYEIEGLDFVTEDLCIEERVDTDFIYPEIGATVKIIEMDGEPQYTDAVGKVTHIDDMGQIWGTWGGCAIIPEVDKYEEI